MSTNEIGIEEGRKRFGDLVIAAEQRGQVTIVTRYGKPAAAIVPINRIAEEQTMSDEIQVLRIVGDDEEEVSGVSIDLDRVTRLDTVTAARFGDGIVNDALTLAQTEDGTPIILVEDNYIDEAGEWPNAPQLREKGLGTALRVKAIWIYGSMEEARSDRERRMEEFRQEPGIVVKSTQQ